MTGPKAGNAVTILNNRVGRFIWINTTRDVLRFELFIWNALR